MKLVMEKSWNMKNWPKVMEFLFQILPLNCTKLVFFLAATKKLCIDLFLAKRCKLNSKLRGKMVMENQEMVMEKSWKNVNSSRLEA